MRYPHKTSRTWLHDQRRGELGTVLAKLLYAIVDRCQFAGLGQEASQIGPAGVLAGSLSAANRFCSSGVSSAAAGPAPVALVDHNRTRPSGAA